MLSFMCLPDDVLCVIFSLCDFPTLRRLCQVCRRFKLLASSDCFWMAMSKKCLATNQVSEEMRSRSCCLLSAKEKCRVTMNWRREKHKENSLLSQKTRYMPWLQMSSTKLWLSLGANIFGYGHRPSGRIHPGPLRVLKGHHEDVCRFAINEALVISGGSDGSIFTWSQENAEPKFREQHAHSGSINGLDVYNDTVVSGSRDKTVKIWSVTNHSLRERALIELRDRVWSVSASPLGDTFVCGTGGCHDHPLILYSLTTGKPISFLGDHYKYGAGVLHSLYEGPHSLLTCGYDTFIRLWDFRARSPNVITWENPYDMAVYCLASDQHVTFVSGSAGHGLVWLWDKRSTRPVKMYYIGSCNSPVYSLAFDPCHLYAALDSSLCLLSFT